MVTNIQKPLSLGIFIKQTHTQERLFGRAALWLSFLVSALLHCLFLRPVYAQTPHDAISIQALESLVDSQQYQEAHQLVAMLIDEHGGELRFDYLAGQSAYYTRHFQEAVFAFERVLLNYPNHTRARLLLAFSYFKVNNFGAAQVELKQLVSLDDAQASPEEKAQILTFLEQIARIEQKRVESQNLTLSLGLGYDSNVSSGTEEDAIFFPSIDDFITISNGTEASDSLAELGLSYRYMKKRTQKSHYRINASLRHLHHNTFSEFDRSLLDLSASYGNAWKNMRYTLTGYLQPMQLDDRYYRVAYGVIGELSGSLNSHWQWAFNANVSKINNAQTDNQDMRRLGASSRFTYLTAHPQIFTFSFHNDDADTPEGKHNGKDYYALSYTYLYPASTLLNLTFFANLEKSRFARPHPTFLQTRDDSGFSASVKADYRLDAHWLLSAFIRYSRKNSNLTLYDYDRSEIKTTLSYVF